MLSHLTLVHPCRWSSHLFHVRARGRDRQSVSSPERKSNDDGLARLCISFTFYRWQVRRGELANDCMSHRAPRWRDNLALCVALHCTHTRRWRCRRHCCASVVSCLFGSLQWRPPLQDLWAPYWGNEGILSKLLADCAVCALYLQ